MWVLLDFLRFCGFVLALVMGFALFFCGLWIYFCVCDFALNLWWLVVDLVVFVEFVMGSCWLVVAGGELWWPAWVWVAGKGGFVLRCSKHTMYNIFRSIFLECKQTLKKKYFP